MQNAQAKSYPDHPGFRGLTELSRETSRAAADKIAPLAKTQAGKILAELLAVHPEGRSSEQIAQATAILVYSVRDRMSGLLADGKVEQTDERTKNGDGNTVVIWRIIK